jgi:nucleoside-diphosphate-sugar epimerase
VHKLNYDIVFFGYGELTKKIIDSLEEKSIKILCISNAQFSKLHEFNSNFIDKLNYSDVSSLQIECKSAIYSWKNYDNISNNYKSISNWLESDNFLCGRSYFLSSAAVYGDSLYPLNESPVNLSKDVSLNPKYILENLLANSMAKKKVLHTNLRISNVYGKNLRYGLIAEIFESFKEGKKLKISRNFEIIRDYISIEDFLYALETLLNVSEPLDVVNISTGIGTSTNQIFQGLLQNGIQVSYDFQVSELRSLKHSSILDCSLLSSLINWYPTPFMDDLNRIVRYSL